MKREADLRQIQHHPKVGIGRNRSRTSRRARGSSRTLDLYNDFVRRCCLIRTSPHMFHAPHQTVQFVLSADREQTLRFPITTSLYCFVPRVVLNTDGRLALKSKHTENTSTPLEIRLPGLVSSWLELELRFFPYLVSRNPQQ